MSSVVKSPRIKAKVPVKNKVSYNNNNSYNVIYVGDGFGIGFMLKVQRVVI